MRVNCQESFSKADPSPHWVRTVGVFSTAIRLAIRNLGLTIAVVSLGCGKQEQSGTSRQYTVTIRDVESQFQETDQIVARRIDESNKRSSK